MGGVGWPCSDLWDPDAVRECGCCHGKHAHCEDVSTDLASTKPMRKMQLSRAHHGTNPHETKLAGRQRQNCLQIGFERTLNRVTQSSLQR